MRGLSDRKVKIVCTIGPATHDPPKILSLVEAGMDVARLNFSHGDHATHQKVYDAIRAASIQTGRNVAVLQDLQGPKIRLGVLPKSGVQLKQGERYLLHPEGSAPQLKEKGVQPLPISAEIAESIAKSLRAGARVLFDDGKVATRVLKISVPEVLVEVEVGGLLTSRKGMNLPGTPLSIPCLTDKDRADLDFGLSLGVDAIALSFVRSSDDIEEVQEIVRRRKLGAVVIAKMEREEAIRDYEAIIDVADGLLVARGDMAVELGADRVPIVQKQLIRACNELGVPIITATQMLESMVNSPTPTRAEANDVANAVFDGTDAVMLSAETASGQYPLEAVRTMDRIIQEAERSAATYSARVRVRPLPGSTVDTIEFSAAQIAKHVAAKAIICLTHTGRAAATLAKYRPETPIVAIVDREYVWRKLALVWGCQCIKIDRIVATDDLFSMIEALAKDWKIAEDGDYIVVTAGIPSLRLGTTNMVKVHLVGKQHEKVGVRVPFIDG